MKKEQYILVGIILLTALIVIPIFVNTIITKKWRNKVKDEADYWKWGIIYYNPEDSRIFLPSKMGLGITLNFANPVSIIISAIFAVIIIIMLFLNFSKP